MVGALRVCYTGAVPTRPPTAGLARLFALAGLAHLAADFLASRAVATTPPYLLLRYAPEDFRAFLEPLSAGVSIAASIVNGAIAALLALVFADRPRGRRFAPLAGALAAAWVVGGALFELVYLSAPWPVALGSLVAGLPRAAAIAWLLDRALGA
jgi:hypothetical protein